MGTLGLLVVWASRRPWQNPAWVRSSSCAWRQQQHLRREFSASADALKPIHKLVVANRGEIASRIFTTARRLGIPTVAVYSEADRAAKHVRLANEAFCIGGAAARDSYLRADAILDVCRSVGGRSVHPGYGFLSENAAFADACHQSGVAFVGPPGSAIRAMGDKSEAKRIMSEAGVPVVPGYHGSDQSEGRLLQEAERIGFPLLVKAVSGGGGKGMKLATAPSELKEAIASAKREAASSFGDDRVLLERYIGRPRHVEVQIVCDAHGNAVYLFDRDCSMQRRHQKVIEEAPAPGLSNDFHRHIGEAAVRAARAVGYVNAGTVEFIVDTEHPQREFYFMEMNTRLQVEHPVTEEVSGVDLVEWQLRVAAGLPLPCSQQQLGRPHGHAFEARLYAENPRRGFLPGAGTLRRWRLPPGAAAFAPPISSSGGAAPVGASPTATTTAGCVDGGSGGGGAVAPPPAGVKVRVDSGVEEGDAVGTWYDPMVAKVITWGPDRDAALAALATALSGLQVAGVASNAGFLRRLATHPAFVGAAAADLTTAFIAERRGELLAPAALPRRAAALAAAARHLLEVASAASAASLPPPSSSSPSLAAASGGPALNGGLGGAAAGGAWGIPDSKRLWGHITRRFDGMAFPEGEGGPDAEVSVAVKVLSGDAFDVTVHAGDKGKVGGDKGAGGAGRGAVLQVRDARLQLTPSARANDNNNGGGGNEVAGSLAAEVDGRRAAADVLMYSQAAWRVLCLWVDGEAYELRWQQPAWSKDAGAQAHAHGAGGQVVAPMPGRAVKVSVKDGDAVAAGATLVVLEAMKMEHAVVAPRAGIARGVSVAVGAQVADGQVLLWVDEQQQQQQQPKQQQKEGEGKAIAA